MSRPSPANVAGILRTDQIGSALISLMRQEPPPWTCEYAPGAWRPATEAAHVVPTGFPATPTEPELPALPEGQDADAIAERMQADDTRAFLTLWNEARAESPDPFDREDVPADRDAEEEPADDPDTGDAEADDGEELPVWLSTAAFIDEWERTDPLGTDIRDPLVRELAMLLPFGTMLLALEDETAILDAFETRHARLGEILEHIDRQMARPPEEPTVAAAQTEPPSTDHLTAAVDAVLTEETTRLPQDIRREVIAFREARRRREEADGALATIVSDLIRLSPLLDAYERAATQEEGGAGNGRASRNFTDTLELCAEGFRALDQGTATLNAVDEEMSGRRTAYGRLCAKARETVASLGQLAAAAAILAIPIPDQLATRIEGARRRLEGATDMYAQEMGLEPERAPLPLAVERLRNSLAARGKSAKPALPPRQEDAAPARTRTAAPPVRPLMPDGTSEPKDLDLVLLCFAIICEWGEKGRNGKPRARSFRIVVEDIMVRAGLLTPKESAVLLAVAKGKMSTKWRREMFVHTQRGKFVHMYSPTPAGIQRARRLFGAKPDRDDLTVRLLAAKREYDIEFFEKRAERARIGA